MEAPTSKSQDKGPDQEQQISLFSQTGEVEYIAQSSELAARESCPDHQYRWPEEGKNDKSDGTDGLEARRIDQSGIEVMDVNGLPTENQSRRLAY